ncbi:MAG: metalloendopeptidase, partial [Firmicutes bacterium]|nr:metalloendopeptidase [Bacillota bacterium]
RGNLGEAADLEKQKQQLRQASQELEAIFLQQMISVMQRTVPRDEGILKRSQAEELFQGMLDEELAKIMAESGETGLARSLYQQLVQSLEEKQKAKSET